ncbi:MAG: alpha/beta hydrolase [Pseudomonadales bacterium]|nr:alpha/beta hydrolase [Pseudomonadales bacterium]
MGFPSPERVTTRGADLEVFRAGTAGAPAIILCHGWPEHAYSWRHQIAPLAAAGFEVIVPNQRGFGGSSCPSAVEAYDIEALTSDLEDLLLHFGHENAIFVGHDWGALVVWAMAVLKPERVRAVANLSVSYLRRGPKPWIPFWREMLGPQHYIVHFNDAPGEADAFLDAHRTNFLRNMYRRAEAPPSPPEASDLPPLLAMAQAPTAPGASLMSDEDLAVFDQAFARTGFTPGINWYRNFDRNWARLDGVAEHIAVPTLMIWGHYDMVPPPSALEEIAPDLEVHGLPCGHWIQQEAPEETNALLLSWLKKRDLTSPAPPGPA